MFNTNALELTVFGLSIAFFIRSFVSFDLRFHLGLPQKKSVRKQRNACDYYAKAYSFNLISGPLDAMIRNKSHLVCRLFFSASPAYSKQNNRRKRRKMLTKKANKTQILMIKSNKAAFRIDVLCVQTHLYVGFCTCNVEKKKTCSFLFNVLIELNFCECKLMLP